MEEKLIYVSFIGLSYNETEKRQINPSNTHKFKGTTKDSRFFKQENWKEALTFINECEKPLTNPSQIAYAMPEEIGKAVVSFEKSKATLNRKLKEF